MRSPEIESSEQNKNEQIASQMQAVLEKVEKPQNRKALGEAGYEFANARYDAGQQVLERNGFWHDSVRGIAVEANSADREKKGGIPMTFVEAKGAINGYAKSLADLGTKEDKRDAFGIESIVRGTERPGVEGIDDALKYIEGVLKSKASLKKAIPEVKQQWDEQRAVRDALFAEKQRRVEQAAVKRPATTGSGLSKEEIDLLNQRDKVELEGLREMFGLNKNEAQKMPTDERGLNKYFRDNFGKMETTSMDDFKKDFTPEVEGDFRAWVDQHVKTLIEGKPAGTRYPDNVASVFGNDAPLLQRIVALKGGKVVNMDKLIRMPFSEVAKTFLNIDLPEDYFNNFSPR